MKSRIVRWGNSLAIRISHSWARQAGIAEGTLVELSLANRTLIIQPTPEPLRLDELLAGVTKQNLHGEWETGPPTGREAW